LEAEVEEFALHKIVEETKKPDCPQIISGGENSSWHNTDMTSHKEVDGTDSNNLLVDYTPVIVMKSMFTSDDTTKKKIFINVCSHCDIPMSKVVVGMHCPRSIPDKSGEDTLVYDICVSRDQFSSDESVEAICSKILNYLNAMLSQEKNGRIDMVYKLPKIKNQFKGSHTASFVSLALHQPSS